MTPPVHSSSGIAPLLPTVGVMRRAVEIYLEHAYPGKPAPENARARIAGLCRLGNDSATPVELFERAAGNNRCVLVLRLGQVAYPHMKLAVECTPDGAGYLLRADAHDSHLHAAAGSPDAGALTQLRAGNQQVVERIETAWALAGLPTFREYLRRELARKREERQ